MTASRIIPSVRAEKTGTSGFAQGDCRFGSVWGRREVSRPRPPSLVVAGEPWLVGPLTCFAPPHLCRGALFFKLVFSTPPREGAPSTGKGFFFVGAS